MTIGRKLEIGVGAMLVVVVAIGIAWLGRLGGQDIDRQSAAERTARRMQITAEMDAAGSEMLAAMRGIVLYSAASQRPQAKLCKAEFELAAASWRKSLGDLQPLLWTDGERRLAGQMQDRMEAWQLAIAKVERAAARGNHDAALKLASSEGNPNYEAIARDTARLREVQAVMQDVQRAGAASALSAGWWTDFGALSMATVAGLLTLFFVYNTSRIAQSTWERAAAPVGELAVAQAAEAGPPQQVAAPVPEAVEMAGSADPITFRRSLLSLNSALEAALSREPAGGLPGAADEAANLVRRSNPTAKSSGPA